MIYLTGVSGSGVRRIAHRWTDALGVLLQPGSYGGGESAWFGTWAADNGCFAQGEAFDPGPWLEWLDALPRLRCLFATAPDVVGDAAATWSRSAPYLDRIREFGFRAALVAQDGLTVATTPWDAFDCLFTGGTTAWKLSEDAYRLAREAQERGKWVHMGRVNSWERVKAAASASYDSVDGTYLAFGPDVNLPRLVGWLEALHSRPFLGQVVAP